ncbi:MAG: circularly permuted type 2 ATP-grasp protein [Chloroflexi bacterium]|nr:circularly permuted type 2 ATP-grasp protein [Chloroflexota bacterium]
MTARAHVRSRRTPADEYHSLLEDVDVAAASATALAAGQRERRLVFGERPLCVSLRPNLVSKGTWESVRRGTETLYGALSRLERTLLQEEDLRRELDLDPEEERLALADPGFDASSPSARFDGFIGDGVIRFVEYNAESPAGMAYNDELVAVFESLPVMAAFRRRWRIRTLPARRHQLAVMLRAYGKRVPARPCIAIVDWRGLPTLTEFEMFQRYFEEQGLACVICAPEDLELRRDRLYARGERVHLVYRRVLTSELLARRDVAKPLVDAYLKGAVIVVNSFRAKILHKKMSLALLSDDRYARLYTPVQRVAIARHIPWTRKVREGHTTYGGRVVDLTEFVLKERARLVLKPNDEYGGKGVVLGWTVDAREWEQAFLAALTSSYVVQERVEIPREPFPVLLENMHFLDLGADLDPYLFWGKAQGNLCRLSSSALLNVTAGAGSVVPTYVVEGRA